MTADELEVLLVKLIREVQRQNSQIQSIRTAVAVLANRQMPLSDRVELEALLSAHQPDAQLQWLSTIASNIRGKIENDRKQWKIRPHGDTNMAKKPSSEPGLQS